MATTTTARKTCFIVTRYFVKRTQSVCCIVRNEQGIDYTTCVHANGRTSCTCIAGEKGMKCYHVKHVLATEAARPASPSVQFVNKSSKIYPRSEVLAVEVVPGILNGRQTFLSTGRQKVSNRESHLYKSGFMR